MPATGMRKTLFLLSTLATVAWGETDSDLNNNNHNQNNVDASAKKHSEKEYRIQGEKQLNEKSGASTSAAFPSLCPGDEALLRRAFESAKVSLAEKLESAFDALSKSLGVGSRSDQAQAEGGLKGSAFRTGTSGTSVNGTRHKHHHHEKHKERTHKHHKKHHDDRHATHHASNEEDEKE